MQYGLDETERTKVKFRMKGLGYHHPNLVINLSISRMFRQYESLGTMQYKIYRKTYEVIFVKTTKSK